MRASRISYVPGFISLVALVPLGIAWLFATDVFHRYSTLTVMFPPLDTTSLPPEIQRWDIPPDRKWSEFFVNGTREEDRVAMGAFEVGMAQLAAHPEDTLNGMHVRFGPGLKYETFIRLMDISLNDTTIFIVDGPDLWAYHLPPVLPDTTEQGPLLTCGTSGLGCYSYPIPPLADRVQAVLPQKELGILGGSWPVLVVSALLTALSVLWVRSRT